MLPVLSLMMILRLRIASTLKDAVGCGTILVHKILGHAAREGKSLADIKALADELVLNIKTIGLALSGATVPEVGKPGFVLEDDEFEYGVGIHGEPGYKKKNYNHHQY